MERLNGASLKQAAHFFTALDHGAETGNAATESRTAKSCKRIEWLQFPSKTPAGEGPTARGSGGDCGQSDWDAKARSARKRGLAQKSRYRLPVRWFNSSQQSRFNLLSAVAHSTSHSSCSFSQSISKIVGWLPVGAAALKQWTVYIVERRAASRERSSRSLPAGTPQVFRFRPGWFRLNPPRRRQSGALDSSLRDRLGLS